MFWRRANPLIAAAVAALLLTACSDDSGRDVLTSQSMASLADPSRFSQRITDPVTVAALNGPTQSGFRYRDETGAEWQLSLGPPYVSARGLTCRIGRPDSRGTTPGAFGILAFCRGADGWYKLRPILLSNS